MRDILINPKIKKEMIISMAEYEKMSSKVEYVLYGDNILEGITLLNIMTEDDDILHLVNVVYDRIDQPIYVFNDDTNRPHCIKICGAYDKWKKPNAVGKITQFFDLPDYVIYSLKSQKVIIAGENTETASVGNSQWQREGRKVGAAREGVPFIYQTFYSGKDESQNTVREPNSLQVYNQILYSIRYKVPSFVAYFENNFEGAFTRKRTPKDSEHLFARYIKSVILDDSDNTAQSRQLRKEYEEKFFVHMLSYLREGKYKSNTGEVVKTPRLDKDFPIINSIVQDAIVNKTTQLAKDIVAYIYGENDNFLSIYPFDDTRIAKRKDWSGYTSKPYIKNLIADLTLKGKTPKSYISGQSKVGIGDTELCRKYLVTQFSSNAREINKILDGSKFPESVIMPLRIHKRSNGRLTFSPDPESGEIVAFGELFGYNCMREKCRPVIGYVIVDTPDNFDINDKVGTKLYKALANYVDIVILNDETVVTKFKLEEYTDDYKPNNLKDIMPDETTEEMGVVSTFLNQSQINADWKLCFIHTHHSSWQQLVIHTPLGEEKQHKIDRVSTKVDLIMQDEITRDLGLFMIAEGKDAYFDLLRDTKIGIAMKDARDLIDQMYKWSNQKFDAFIYNLDTVPQFDPQFYVDSEVSKIKHAIMLGHFNHIAAERDYVIIIVYNDSNNKTGFKLVYSTDFDKALKAKLDKEFKQ